jgi:hypothetical protein
MPIKGSRENIKLKIVIMVMLAGGAVWAELGQKAGACRGVPDLGERYVFAIVPYALLAFGLLLLARSRADLVVLLVCAVLIVIANLELLGSRDELGLVCPFVPIMATMLVIPALVAALIRRWVARWLRHRKEATHAPVQNRLP